MNYPHPSKCYQFLTLGWSSWKTKWISDEMLMQKGPVQNRFLALNHSVNNNAINIYHCQIFRNLKFDNLQYNMLVRWVPGTNDWSTKCLMFQVLSFFIISCKILCKNPFNFFYNFKKIKIKSFVCPKSKPATPYFIFNLSK